MHHVSPYNEFGCNDFAHDRGYSRETMRGVAHYTRPEVKYKKGAVAQIIGAVVAVVATVFTAGAAAAVIGPTLLGSTMLASVAAGAVGGMVGGALGAFVGGGDVGRGALFGAIGGGITGGMGGFGGGDGVMGSIYNAGGEAAGALGAGGAGSVGATAGLTVAGGEAATTVGTEGAALGNTAAQGGSVSAGLDGAVAAAAPGAEQGVAAGLDTAAMQGTSSVVNPTTGAGYSMATPAGQYDMSSVATSSGSAIRDAAAQGGLAIPGQAAPGAPGMLASMAQGVKDIGSNKLVQEAGLKLGSQYLGSQADATGSGDMKSYLNDVKAMEQQSQQFNQSMANQKAGIGNKLQNTADNIDPQYYAMQGMTQTKNRDANAWADQEARMRAQGAGQDAIDAERHRQGVQSSQNQGTAYDSGFQTGRSQQNATYGAAGSMYGQVSSPTAGLAGAYGSMNNANAQAQKDWGYGIEQAGQVLTGTSKKTNQNTSE